MDDHDNAATLEEHARRQRTGVAALVAIAESTAPTRLVPATSTIIPSDPAAGANPETHGWLSWWPWVLPCILVVQAALSLRLMWSNTAFPDEALYLWAGHLEWSHWLFGSQVPQFQIFFSGSPILYPPLGALADTFGGLVGARVLSLLFMLGATTLLHGSARRMFGKQAAAFASALFGSLASVQYLGAFATYDAMALYLIALAMWLGIRALDTRPVAEVTLQVAAAATLALADATKYAAALFTPIVILAVVLLTTWRRGIKAGLDAGMTIFWSVYLILAGILFLGGRSYWHGITTTTLARMSGSYAASFLLYVSGKWIGALALLAVIGALSIGFAGKHLAAAGLGWVLTGAALLVPIEQARIHTYTSLFKHLGYGAWFGALMAGYCLASFRRSVAPTKAIVAIKVGIAAVVLAAIPAVPLAASHYGWPNTAHIIPVMYRVLATTHGPVLADDRGNVLDYYLPEVTASRQISGTFFFAYNDPVTGAHQTGRAAYAVAVHRRYFAVIFLEFWDSSVADHWIQSDINHYGGYRLVATIPYAATGHHGNAMIWERA